MPFVDDLLRGGSGQGPDGTSMVPTAVFSPDGRTLACGGVYGGPVVQPWDVVTGKPEGDAGGHLSAPYAVALSPEGTRVAAGGDREDTLCLWEAGTGKPVGQVRLPG